MQKDRYVSLVGLRKSRLVIISLLARRDLEAPLGYFKELEVFHLYRRAPYKDMVESAREGRTLRYRNAFDLYLKIKNIKPDIIQGIEPCVFPAGIGEYLTILATRYLLKIPFFFPMLENRPLEKKFGVILAIFVKIYLRFYTQAACAVIPLNNGARHSLLKAGIKGDKFINLLWGTWGVDLEEFSPKANGREPDLGREHIILFVGRLEESKGISYLLKAFLKVREKIKDVKLVIIGEGPSIKLIDKFIKEQSLQEGIICLGAKRNEDLPGYFRKAFVTASPSVTSKRWEEQVGMVNIQSMACGTPVVSTLSGAIPEFVKDGVTGLLVPERDVFSLTEAILHLLTDEALRGKMSISGRRFCEERYNAVYNVGFAEREVIRLLNTRQK